MHGIADQHHPLICHAFRLNQLQGKTLRPVGEREGPQPIAKRLLQARREFQLTLMQQILGLFVRERPDHGAFAAFQWQKGQRPR